MKDWSGLVAIVGGSICTLALHTYTTSFSATIFRIRVWWEEARDCGLVVQNQAILNHWLAGTWFSFNIKIYFWIFSSIDKDVAITFSYRALIWAPIICRHVKVWELSWRLVPCPSQVKLSFSNPMEILQHVWWPHKKKKKRHFKLKRNVAIVNGPLASGLCNHQPSLPSCLDLLECVLYRVFKKIIFFC